jgi:RHS repeat-associated protein
MTAEYVWLESPAPEVGMLNQTAQECTSCKPKSLYRLKYFLTDHLGSVVVVTDTDGALLSQQRYMPFGQVRTDVGNGVDQTDFGYTGQRDMDAQGNQYSLGLMDYRARMYSPLLGSFIQPDSIVPGAGNPQAWNRYAYVFGNPLIYSDPSGHGCYIDGNYIPDPSACDWIRQESTSDVDTSTGTGDNGSTSQYTEPIESWDEIRDSENRDVEAGVRLLLAEMGSHFVTNKNWRQEGIGILLVIINRVEWMKKPEPKSWFTGCTDFFSCATAPGQFATSEPRALDPLFLDPPPANNKHLISYFGSEDAAEVAVERALELTVSFLKSYDPNAFDSTGEAHWFSHDEEGNTRFSTTQDLFSNGIIITIHIGTFTVPFDPYP